MQPALGIEYGKAVVSWTEFARRRSRKQYPVFSGVVIRRADRARLMQAVAEKEANRRKKVARLPVLAAAVQPESTGKAVS